MVALEHEGPLLRGELPVGAGIDPHRAPGELVLEDVVLDQHAVVPDRDSVPDVDDAIGVPFAGFLGHVFGGAHRADDAAMIVRPHFCLAE